MAIPEYHPEEACASRLADLQLRREPSGACGRLPGLAPRQPAELRQAEHAKPSSLDDDEGAR